MNTIVRRRPADGADAARGFGPEAGGVTGVAAAWHGAGNAPARPFVAGAESDDAAARRLRDTAERAARRPEGRVALVLRLSRLRPPAPQPHHRRVARALLEDAAQRHEGQVFALRNGDLAMICGIAPPVLALPHMLARLLGVAASDPAGTVTLWPLVEDAARLLAYAAERLADHAPAAPDPPDGPPPVSPRVIETILTALDRAGRPAGAAPGWTARGWIVLLDACRTAQAALRPLLQEIGFAAPALAAAAAAAAAALATDPCLSAHLAGQLDGRLLALLAAARGGGGVLDVTAPGRVPTLLALTPATLMGPDFAALARQAGAEGAPLTVAVGFAEACADAATFGAARRLAAELACRLVLDGVTFEALLLTRPWLLGTDLIRLDWSPLLPGLPAAEQARLGAALRAVGAARIVLRHAADEAALRWGLAHGIRRFQGPHVATMLAAARLGACPDAAACTLGQCAARGAATAPEGRHGCHRPSLLDSGAPAA